MENLSSEDNSVSSVLFGLDKSTAKENHQSSVSPANEAALNPIISSSNNNNNNNNNTNSNNNNNNNTNSNNNNYNYNNKDTKSVKSDGDITPSLNIEVEQLPKIPAKLTEVKCVCLKPEHQKDFFQCMKDIKTHNVSLLSVPDDAKVAGYMLDDINMDVHRQHVDRLKHSHGINFLTTQTFMKQMEKESIPTAELPRIGMWEVDLPLLRDVVDSFGGIERVNRDQSWKSIADSIHIPKTASRRVQKTETTYLKYILPYQTLSVGEQEQLRDSVQEEIAQGNSFRCISNVAWSVESLGEKEVTAGAFKKMADGYQNMYCKNGSTEAVENMFWETVGRGKT